MTKELKDLLAAAEKATISPQESEAQRRSFAYGNTNIENPRITRETVNAEAEQLEADEK
jgi:hypothetical protein